MATKYELITERYLNTAGEIAKPEVWPSFLTTACHNFRLSFDKQVLLYAQRPDATAVLPIEGKHGWNQKFGRWVNRGSKGIALFDSDRNGVATLKYYFDISDTHEGRYPRPVPIWSVRPEFEQDILETLENRFGDLQEKDTLASGLISAAQNVVEDNIADYLEQLMYYREGSFLEPLDDESIAAILKPLLQSSVGYMLLVRCGIDPSPYYQKDDFGYISGFNTLQTINTLGTATSDISQMVLSEIARTTLSLQRQAEKQNRTFEDTARKEYAVPKKETTQQERSIDHDSDHLQQTGRLSSSQPSPAPAAESSPWEVRIDAQPVSEGESENHIHESDDQRQAEPAPAGGRGDGQNEDRADGIPDGTDGGLDGGTESHRPDEVGGSDEQYQGIGGGTDSEGTDLRIEQEPAAPEIPLTADPELPPLLEERFITAILENRDDDLKSPKKEIQNFFRENYEQNKRAEYLKAVYPDRFTELIVDGTRIGYKATDDGLLMWEGAYLSRTKESVFSWGIVAELTGNLIDQGTYFFDAKIKAPPSYEDQQIYFMDGGYLAPEPEDDQQFTFFSQPELPQQVIDEALCIGFNDRDSRLTYLFPILRYHDRWSQLTSEDFTYWFRRDTVSHNGYLMQTGIKPYGAAYVEPPLADYSFGENSWHYLDKMVRLCNEHGTQLVLIKAPSLSPVWWEQWDTQIKEHANQNGLLYINMLDYQEEIGIDWKTDTYDAGLHLNVYGAEKASIWFGAILAETCDVQDRRKDETIAALWRDKTASYYDQKRSLENEKD